MRISRLTWNSVVAERIEHFTVLVPAGTTRAAPQTTSLSFNAGIVERIEILVPPGPSGLAGFRILHSNTVVIPYDPDEWIIADNEVLKWSTEGYPTGSAWGFRAHNTDVFDHTFYLRLFVVETRRSDVVRAQLVSIAPSGTAEDSLSAD